MQTPKNWKAREFNLDSPYERGEMVTMPDGRVVEAFTQSKGWRNIMRCLHKATPEQKQATRERLLWWLYDKKLRTEIIN